MELSNIVDPKIRTWTPMTAPPRTKLDSGGIFVAQIEDFLRPFKFSEVNSTLNYLFPLPFLIISI